MEPQGESHQKTGEQPFQRLDGRDPRVRLAAEIIVRLRSKLLDLTNRNPLLNYRHSERARGQVRVVDELPDILFGRLGNGGRLTFRALPEPGDEPGDEKTDDFRLTLEAARLEDSEYLDGLKILPEDDPNGAAFLRLERALRDRVRTRVGLPPRPHRRSVSIVEWAKSQGVDPSYDLPVPELMLAERHQDDEIQTLLFPERMEAKLSALREGTRRALEETGINTLFAAYGFLEWYESADSQKATHAPLLLQPLEIERVSQRGRWRYWVRGTGEEAAGNVTLAARLKQDFGLDLPQVGESETPETYVAHMAEVIRSQPRWRIRRFVTCGLFAFGRLAMWHDLDPARWPEGRRLATSSVIATLLAGGGGEQGMAAVEYEVDSPEIAPDVPPHILSADASQTSVIVDVMRGRNLAVKGPPGTGKSQTIANVIAGAMARGKRVLFVAEKMAALEIVKKRLDDAELGHFVLELHSTKARKKDLLASLASRLEQQAQRDPPRRIGEERFEIDRLKRRLNEYAALVNRPFGATQRTVHDILWGAQRRRVEDGPTAVERVVLKDVERLSLSDLRRAREALAQYEVVGREIHERWGSVKAHPWAWVGRALSPFEAEDLLIAMREWHECLGSRWATVSEHAGKIARTRPDTLRDARRVVEAIGLMPDTVPDDVDLDLFARLGSEQNQQAVAVLVGMLEERARISRRWAGKGSVERDEARVAELRSIAGLAGRLGVTDQRGSELPGLSEEADISRREWEAAAQAGRRVAKLLGMEMLTGQREHELIVEAASLVAGTVPAALMRRRKELGREENRARLAQAADRGRRLRESRKALEERYELEEGRSSPELREAAGVLWETSFWRRWSPRYRWARDTWRRIRRGERTADRDGMAIELETVAIQLEEEESFEGDSELRQLFGSGFKGVRTDFESFVQAGEFAGRAMTLTGRGSDFEGRLRRVLLDGDPGTLVQLRGWTHTEDHRALARVRERYGVEGWGDLRGAEARARDRTAGLKNLMERLDGAGVVGELQLRDVEQLATDADRVRELDGQLGELGATALGREMGLESGSLAVLKATLRFAEVVAAAMRAGDGVLAVSPLQGDTRATLEAVNRLGQDLHTALQAEQAARARVMALAGSGREGIEDSPVVELIRWLEGALTAVDGLDEWSQLQLLREEIRREGALPSLEAYGEAAPEGLADTYEAVFWWSLARRAFEEYPELKGMSGSGQATARRQLREAEGRVLELNRREIGANLCRVPIPQGSDRGARSEWTGLALVRHQAELQRPRIAIRDLIRRGGDAILAMKPCWMMSPISVAQFLEPGRVEFDLVVIDEASQMRSEEAVGAIGRGRQLVVVGDPMQLPPTAFFDRMEQFDDEVEDSGDEESILDLALGMFHPYRHLRWHYRSRHESLIRFSNRQFYDDKLIVFPASGDGRGELGVWYHRVEGVYPGRGGNPDEVRAVAPAVIEMMDRFPKRSLGVVTVNREQAELLRMEIDRLVVRNESAQEYLARWEGTLEPFFVKNLENVQGDERDIIMISTVYGPDEKGRVMQRFGPINQKTGHRRLNVLFTRAKCRVDLFTSLTAADVRDDESTSWGAKALRGYLEYAATGRLEAGEATRREPESDFEVWVAEALRAHGYEVTPQVGVRGFYIDLAVRHGDYPHGYLAGIECDGASYHSAKAARDRDVLRQAILEELGWTLYRVWSTDWFANPRRELERLLRFLDDLLKRER